MAARRLTTAPAVCPGRCLCIGHNSARSGQSATERRKRSLLSADGEPSAGNGYRVTCWVFCVCETISICLVRCAELKSLLCTMRLKALDVFHVENQLYRRLPRLQSLSGLMNHDDGAAMRRDQLCYATIGVELALKFEVSLVEGTGCLHVFRIQHYPIQ
jgi:hypothetical protein